MAMAQWLNIALQVTVAFIFVLVLYLVTLIVLNIDAIVKTESTLQIKKQETTVILDGFATPSYIISNFALGWNTIYPSQTNPNYARILKSVNENGGASFTYQFWMKIEDVADENFQNLTILLKGDNKKYKVGYYRKENDIWNLVKSSPTEDTFIACPKISFGDSYKQIKVTFNTINSVDNTITIDMRDSGESTARKNLLSLLPVNWTLLTFVLEDNYSITESSENGIKFTFYVNDIPYWIESASSMPLLKNDALRQNDGNFFLFPNATVKTEFMKIGNIRYYNYAVSLDSVTKTFNMGPPSLIKATINPHT
jgi:hypothetical protein